MFNLSQPPSKLFKAFHTCHLQSYSFRKWISIPISIIIVTNQFELIRSRVWLSEIVDDDAAVPSCFVRLQQWHSPSEPSLHICVGLVRVEYCFYIWTSYSPWFTSEPNHFDWSEIRHSVGTWYHDTKSGLCWNFCLIQRNTEMSSTEIFQFSC